MGDLAKNFPRFPHHCVVYQYEDITGFETEEEISSKKEIIWEGRCRKESNTSVRTFKGTENVLKGDYRVQLGAIVDGDLSGDENAEPNGKAGEECGAIVDGITAGMYIEVKDRNGVFTLNVNDSYAGNLGTTLYCDESKT